MKADQPRVNGKFGQKPGAEKRGDAIALRLPVALDAQVRAAAGWQSAADNSALRDWVETALREKAEGRGQRAEGYTPERIREAINRIALQTPPKQRGAVLKQFNALVGELLANGD
ncbi:MAG: hypothetical protein KME27_23120 [Lyngbya sp. HA4199-MV5]|jgi:hypothetical protein|nr:hypothetical protein [Lyngbya sp. HA4199-MV5]